MALDTTREMLVPPSEMATALMSASPNIAAIQTIISSHHYLPFFQGLKCPLTTDKCSTRSAVNCWSDKPDVESPPLPSRMIVLYL